MSTYDQSGTVVEDTSDDALTWQQVREGMTADQGGQVEIDEQTGAPAVTVTVTNKGSNLLGLAFLAAALYFLMSGGDG